MDESHHLWLVATTEQNQKILLPSQAPRSITKFSGFGRTFEEKISNLGSKVGLGIGNIAHKLGHGPTAITNEIVSFIDAKNQRKFRLAELHHNLYVKSNEDSAMISQLEKSCQKLMRYSRPDKTVTTQLQTFKSILALSTGYPGMRSLFLRCDEFQGMSVPPDAGKIEQTWKGGAERSDPEWLFYLRLAACCLSEKSFAVVDQTNPTQRACIYLSNERLSIIENLLLEIECDGITGMSGVISIRYLGGILCLDTFWLKIHYEDHQSVAKKMFNRIGALLADIGLSTDHTDARNVNLVVVDTEGIDMLVQSTLVGMQLWRQQLNDQQLLLAEWFSYFQNLILLLLREDARELVPKSANGAGYLKDFCKVDLRSQSLEILVENPSLNSNKDAMNALPMDMDVQKAAISFRDYPKILLLGSSGSGKTTVRKQLSLIHEGFSPRYLEGVAENLFDYLSREMPYILDDIGVTISSDTRALLSARIDEVEQFSERYPILKSLLEDSRVRNAIFGGKFNYVADGNRYLYSQLNRFHETGYQITQQDALHQYTKSTGITETDFRNSKQSFRVLDPGGTRSERKKWIHCFPHVTLIVFLVPLSAYDMTLLEDSDTNQMADSMQLWEAICNSKWFRDNSFLLLLNKYDLFTEKVRRSDINTFFPDYDGRPNNAIDGRNYFKNRFLGLVEKRQTDNRKISIHFTNATDKELPRIVMAAIEE